MEFRTKLCSAVFLLGLSGCGGSTSMPLTAESVQNLNAHVNMADLANAFEPCRNSVTKKELESLNLKYMKDYSFDWFEGGEVLPKFKQDLENHEKKIAQLNREIQLEKPTCNVNASKVLSEMFTNSGYNFEASLKDIFSSITNYTAAQKLGIVDTILPTWSALQTVEGEKGLIKAGVISSETIEYIKSQIVILNGTSKGL